MRRAAEQHLLGRVGAAMAKLQWTVGQVVVLAEEDEHGLFIRIMTTIAEVRPRKKEIRTRDQLRFAFDGTPLAVPGQFSACRLYAITPAIEALRKRQHLIHRVERIDWRATDVRDVDLAAILDLAGQPAHEPCALCSIAE